MANTDQVPASKSKMLLGDIAQGRANSEAVMAKISGNINAISDSAYNNMEFRMNGYVANMTNTADVGWDGVRRITANVNISEYYLSLAKSGSGSSCNINFAVYDETGAFVNNLFSAAISISGNGGSNVLIGRDNEAVSTFAVNNAGHSINYGTLNLTTLSKGWIIQSNIGGGKNGAKNLFFNMKLKEV